MSALGDTCPFGLCDGTGFVVDEATRVAQPAAAARGASSATARAASAP